MGRGIAWMPTDLGRARTLVEKALDMFEEQGLQHFHDALAANTVHWFILFFKGDWADLLEVVDTRRVEALQGFVPRNHVEYFRCRLHAARGDVERARASADRIAEQCRSFEALSLITPSQYAVDAYVLNAEGRHAEALDACRQAYRVGRQVGAFFSRMTWCMAREPELEAVVGLAGQNALTPRDRRHGLKLARQMTRRGLFDFPALGWRAIALLQHSAHKEGAARRALERALRLSATGSAPYHRWQTLEAARAIGVMNSEQEAEAEQLSPRATPPG